MTVNKDYLEIEKLRAELLTELARRHNWAEQEKHWQDQQAFWQAMAKYTGFHAFAVVAAVAALFGGLVVKLLEI